jgi:3-phosphoshikimate 1-carboxyvinyltransferase
MTQRALVQAFWTDPAAASTGVFVQGALDSDDPRALAGILSGLGARVHWEPDGVRVVPPADARANGQLFDCGNAGTAVRFGAALALGVHGTFTIDGDARMRERPLGPLIGALRSSGVGVEDLGEPGFPPVRLRGTAQSGTELTVDSGCSSQFASALLLSAPVVPDGCTIRWSGGEVSRPYLAMTLAMMRSGGVQITEQANGCRVEPGRYRNDRYMIEPDASSASFLLAAGLLLGQDVSIRGLLPAADSLQGDAVFMQLAVALREGANELDLSDVPDLLPPLSVLALCEPREVTLTGIGHTRIKECDRPTVLATGFRRLGAEVNETKDRIRLGGWDRSKAPTSAELEPAADHRMAMAFGLLQLLVPSLTVVDPDCVSKSFPGFWQVLSDLARGGRHG